MKTLRMMFPGARVLVFERRQVRSIRLDQDAAILDDPYVRGSMKQALKGAAVDLTKRSGRVELRSTISPRQIRR